MKQKSSFESDDLGLSGSGLVGNETRPAHRPLMTVIAGVALGYGILTGCVSARAQVAPNDPADTHARVAKILSDWENLPGVFDDIDIYTAQIKELAQMGKPVVPALGEALDRTSSDTPLRLLAFTLRAIGDARAVPALIRAIPKTLLPPGSDCAMSVKDTDLLNFMLSNDLQSADGEAKLGRRNFDMGRPIREVCGALKKITGTQLDESGIFMTFLEGGEQQRANQRKAYHEVARHWAEWWKTNWSRFVDEPFLADVHLPALKETPTFQRFLTGADVRTNEGEEGMILSPAEQGGKHCALALNLNRMLNLPKELSATNAEGNFMQNVSAWAARAGADLIGTLYREPQSGKTFYCVRGLGLQAWEVPNGVWTKIGEDLHREGFPDLTSPAGDVLMHYDAEHNRYVPERKATFLFIARDGSQGILRVRAQVVRPWSQRDLGLPTVAGEDSSPDQTQDSGPYLGVKVDYKLFYQETEQLKAEAKARQDEKAAKAKARQSRKIAGQLEKYPHLPGKVYLPDGRPVSNAAVLLAIKGEAAILGDRRFLLAERSTLVHTSPEGDFILPQIPGAQTIYVAHPDGFAEVSLTQIQAQATIHLARWGRVEGTLTLEGKPASHQKVGVLKGMATPGVYALSLSPDTFTAETDDQGHFVFEGLPPGEIQVCRLLNRTYYEAQFVNVASGKTTEFKHGFNGCRVIGHFVASSTSSNLNWNSGRFTFSTRSKAPEPPAGEDPREWMERFWQSDEGKARQRATHSFGVVVKSNGEFWIDDVPPGTYELRGELREGSADLLFLTGKALGRINQEVVVPERPGRLRNESVDLGELVVQMVKNLSVGDLAPDFEVPGLEGGTMRLSQLRGKYVLIDFWATWCGPCRAETPSLKAAFDTCGKDPRFAMIGLSLDKAVEAPREYARKEGIAWAQGFLGDWSKATLPAQYGVEGIPAIFLVDPEGRIIGTDLRGENIRGAVERVLGKERPPESRRSTSRNDVQKQASGPCWFMG